VQIFAILVLVFAICMVLFIAPKPWFPFRNDVARSGIRIHIRRANLFVFFDARCEWGVGQRCV
jgi:hypothetical protein